MVKGKSELAKGTWLTYRPDIKVLDCTVRDGGLINNHMFDDGFVKAVYDCRVAAGVDYMELGYKGSSKIFSRDEYGSWKFTTEDDLRRIVGDNDTSLVLCAMADAERTDYHTDILPRQESVLGMIRVATYIHQIPVAMDMIKDAHDKGYETTVNLMAVSAVQERELLEALDSLAKSEVGTIYMVDSFGSFYSEQIRDLTLSYLKAVEGTGSSLDELISDLDSRHPGLRERIVEDGALRRFVNVYLNDEDVRFLGGITTPVADGDVVTVLPAVAGG